MLLFREEPEGVRKDLPNLRKGKVIVIHESGSKTYNDIEQYGEAIVICKGYVSMNQEDLERVRFNMIEHIKKAFTMDLVLLSGPPILVAMFTQIWFEHHYIMRTLSWIGNKYIMLNVEDSTDHG